MVVQHPDPASLPSLWAHHEKIDVVDVTAVYVYASQLFLFVQGSAAPRSCSASQPMGSPREDGRR
jgi:hypothetical protein